ncbi:MAG: hypothetical protein ABIK28_14545 [Planctomycetota bacterium]
MKTIDIGKAFRSFLLFFIMAGFFGFCAVWGREANGDSHREIVEQLESSLPGQKATGEAACNTTQPEISERILPVEAPAQPGNRAPLGWDFNALMSCATSSHTRGGSKAGGAFFGEDLLGGTENTDSIHRNPTMAFDSNGTLYLAFEEQESTTSSIRVYCSTSYGIYWTSMGGLSVACPQELREPSLALGEGASQTLILAYILDDNSLPVPRISTKNLDNSGSWVVHPITVWSSWDGYAKPVVWTDSVQYNSWFVHLTCEGIFSAAAENVNVCTWRSTNFGNDWSNGIVALGNNDADAWLDPDGCFGTADHHVFLTCYNKTSKTLYAMKSVDDGQSWNAPLSVYVLDDEPAHSVDPEIAAAMNDPNLLICHTRHSTVQGSDCIGYAYSRTSGDSWSSGYTLNGSTSKDEFAPALIACEGGGSFHLTFTTADRKVKYSKRSQALSDSWLPSPEQVNEGSYASTQYPSKAIAAFWEYDKVFTAWSDFRDAQPDYDIYLDYAGNVDELTVPDDTATIQEAMDAMLFGKIYVEPGLYRENLDFKGKTLGILASEGADYTVINGMQNGPVVTIEDNDSMFTMLIGFTITNGFSLSGGGGFHLENSTPILGNNVIVDNNATLGGGIYCKNAYPYAVNNTVYGNWASAAGGGIYVNTMDVAEFSNSIFWNNSSPAGTNISYAGVEPDVIYCDVEGGWSGEGNIDSDPLFVDAANGDFHLLYASPCRDAGTDSLLVYPLVDNENDPRMDGDGLYDIGADEFYRHFYYKGAAKPGCPIVGRLVDVPDTTPMGIWFGMGVLESPMHTQWGEFFLVPPYIFVGPLGSMVADGVLDLYAELPVWPAAPYDIPAQAMIGDAFTNPMIIRVR